MTHKKLKKAAKQFLAKAFKKAGANRVQPHVIHAAVAVALSYKAK